MELEIDNTAPTAAAALVDLSNEVIHTHGERCTRLAFDKVERMPISYFVEHVAPHIKTADDLTVIRNSAAGEYTFLLGDHAVRYHLTGVSECSVADLCRFIGNRGSLDLATNIRRPVVRYIRSDNGICVTVRVDPSTHPFRLHVNSPRIRLETTIVTPPLWVTVVMSENFVHRSIKVAVVPDMPRRWQDTKLYRWPLFNVGRDGSVCTGRVVVDGNAPEDAGSCVENCIGILLDSLYNTDLAASFRPSDATALDKLYRELPADGDIVSALHKLNGSKVITVLKAVRLLQQPKGYLDIPYSEMGCTSAEEFTNAL